MPLNRLNSIKRRWQQDQDFRPHQVCSHVLRLQGAQYIFKGARFLFILCVYTNFFWAQQTFGGTNKFEGSLSPYAPRGYGPGSKYKTTSRTVMLEMCLPKEFQLTFAGTCRTTQSSTNAKVCTRCFDCYANVLSLNDVLRQGPHLAS